VGGYVSEKWFYTHLKIEQSTKLPRLDMLQLLAQYVGYTSWEDFLNLNTIPIEKVIEAPTTTKLKSSNNNYSKYIAASVSLLIIVLGSLAFVLLQKKAVYQFCIVDIDDGIPIDYRNIEVFSLKENESPLALSIDSLACLELPIENQKEVQLKIEALYYKPMTITRIIDQQKKQEVIKLKKDDYALMIHYFSTNKMEDWNKRRKQLDLMLNNNAKIIQVNDQTGGGMAMYNKEEFINKMTMPIQSLKNIEILNTKYHQEKIIEIRFKQKTN
jgi:hypothetical protein